MNEEAQKYREEKREKMNYIRDFISERYVAFYEVAEMLLKVKEPATKIETPFGDFSIFPQKKDA